MRKALDNGRCPNHRGLSTGPKTAEGRAQIAARQRELGAGCRPAKPIAVMMINDTADQIVPYAGGPVQPGGLFNAWPAERLVIFFRQLNACIGTVDQSVLPNVGPNKVEVARWTACAGSPVAFYRVIGGGHVLPAELNVGRLPLDFFRDKARA
jgi:polyhydroxybutyrate depolymerase